MCTGFDERMLVRWSPKIESAGVLVCARKTDYERQKTHNGREDPNIEAGGWRRSVGWNVCVSNHTRYFETRCEF